MLDCSFSGDGGCIAGPFLAGGFAAGAVAPAAVAQHRGWHPTPPAAQPYSRLQGGIPRHLTPDLEAQPVFDSPALKDPPSGRRSPACSGHGFVIYRGRYWAMVGEGGIISVSGDRKALRQMDGCDPATDTGQQHAPMLTPRPAVGATAINGWIYVAGGVLGGSVQSAVHDAFTLG